MSKLIVLLTAVIAAVLAVGSASGGRGPGFTAAVTNQWFPLTPGTTYMYEGIKDGKRLRDVFTVTHRTTTIKSAPCVVVDDRLYLAGRLAERTSDYYSQDRAGNVWYFGEDTAELDANGHVKTRDGT